MHRFIDELERLERHSNLGARTLEGSPDARRITGTIDYDLYRARAHAERTRMLRAMFAALTRLIRRIASGCAQLHLALVKHLRTRSRRFADRIAQSRSG